MCSIRFVTTNPFRRTLSKKRTAQQARKKLHRIAIEARRKNDLRRWAKATSILGFISGRSMAELAKEVGATRGTVSKWIANYEALGFESLRTRRPPGRPPRLSPEQMDELSQTIEDGPQQAGFHSGVWTARMIREFIWTKYRIDYNWKYVPRLLHRLGFSVQRPRKLLSRADHEAQAHWLKKRLPAIKKKLEE